ncbi:hypothetical protein niasHT_026847 [Heterodera trifolii]|uniref:C2H2-type domain-containing protein n=1 Tax=Heterodera trifolii TaxID=157864 RepID=A0ABD2K4D7_9BILA
MCLFSSTITGEEAQGALSVCANQKFICHPCVPAGQKHSLTLFCGVPSPLLCNPSVDGKVAVVAADDNNGTPRQIFICCDLMLQQQQQISLVPQPGDVSQQHPQHKAFVCEICGKAFRFRSNLAEHRSVHTAVKPFVCKFCGKSSRLKGNLTKHILKHHKIEQKEYIGTEDYIIKKGKKSVKDPAAIEFLEKSMIILNNGGNSQQNNGAQQQHFMHTAPGSNQSADSGGTDQQNGGEFDGPGILLSLGLDSGSLDLKAEEAMDEGEEDETNFGHFQSKEDTNGIPENNSQQRQVVKQYQQMNSGTANERLLEHCESAICSGDAEPMERRTSDAGVNESDADGTSVEDCSGAECQSSGDQSPILPVESSAGTNALAAAACKALLFGQMDSKVLAKTLLSSSRTANICGAIGQQKDSAADLSNPQQMQATNDEIMRILQQVSSLTDQQQQQQQQQNHQNDASSTAAVSAAAASSKLATQCQLCGKHFRKPRDLIAHLASNAHKFPALTPPTATAPNWPHGSNNGTNPLLGISSANGTPQMAEQTHGQNVQQQQEVIGRLFKEMSPATSLTTASTTKASNFGAGDDGNHQQQLVANELKELRNTVADLRTSAGSSSKLEQMLSQLDSRVCRLEKQLDMALNSIYTLVQLQTGINNSVQKLASITPNINRSSLKTEQ